MSNIIKKLYEQSMEPYTYTDCDGGNNRGVQLNEIEFAKRIIKECLKVNDQCQGHRIGDIDLNVLYSTHFNLDVTK